jgi:Asp-tRNA(Asn)/Glu-tRNA(Gln) amidotransferase A subunit family amidase
VTELHRLTAIEASRSIARREITSEELVRACLERIRARESSVLAWAHLDEAGALKAAQAADATPRRHPLHGIPFGVKDIIDTAELPTEYGSTVFKGHRPQADAACVRNMKATGAVLLGKTVSTEFATFHPGPTRNPHGLDHTPGGSSSGSAAAVADDMVPLAFGSQTAGSLIRPASFCGVCGFKPTWGVIDVGGVLALERSFDTVGFYGRSFEDVTLFFDAVRGVDADSSVDEPGWPLRVGFYRTLERRHADSASVAAVEAAAGRLEALGADVEETELPPAFFDLSDVHTTMMQVGVARSLRTAYEAHPDHLSDNLRQLIEKGLKCSPADHQAAVDRADVCRRNFNVVLDAYDVLLCPSATGEAPTGLGSTGDPTFQAVWTLLHVPCVTVPGATGSQGLPVGVQFVARQHDDQRLLALARWFHRQWP